MGVAVAPPTLLAASERKICNICHRAAEPLAPAGELSLESVRRQTGEGPGLVLHNVPGSETPALHLTKSRLELEATPLRTHCGGILHVWVAQWDACWRTNDTGSPHDFIQLKAPATPPLSVSPWRLNNSQEFSRIWRGIKSDPFFRWVRLDATGKFFCCQLIEVCTKLRWSAFVAVSNTERTSAMWASTDWRNWAKCCYSFYLSLTHMRF